MIHRRSAQYTSRILICILLLALVPGCSKQSTEKWSIRMADSVMLRNPEPWMIDFRTTPKWEYTQGLVLKALEQVWLTTGEQKYLDYVKTYYDQFINDDGEIWLHKKSIYNIDRINPGKVLFSLYDSTGNEKFKKAIFRLRDQMKTHPRTSEGGFWHKKVYPHQMWVDGIYMASPFLAQFARDFDEPELFDDVAKQIILMEKNARDAKTGLLYHGWDESRTQRWSNPETGCSPHFWGRGMGWYSMALVDVLDFLPRDHARRPEIIAILNRLMQAVTAYQDESSGVWYQVVDQAGREGNYLESSASCMFVYTLLKAVRLGYVDSSYRAAAVKGYAGILKEFIELLPDGTVNLHQGCAVAGLGGNPYRDGSYEYYINTEIRSNDTKSVGPFILASLEMERSREY